MNRRAFLKTSVASGGSLVFSQPGTGDDRNSKGKPIEVPSAVGQVTKAGLPDLSPARWIWFPSGRTLPSSFFLFRRSLSLSAKPRQATGWICADSRYRLEVNGHRIQWGPAPGDPRWSEADPMDLSQFLEVGENVFGITVLFYGAGDGTWPLGKPGFLFWLEIVHSDGRLERVVSDETWIVSLCRAWPAGRPKRWYLRALQEEFDARFFPYGWGKSTFEPGPTWLPAMTLRGSPNRPALATDYYEYQLDLGSGPRDSQLRSRSIPMLRESFVPARKLAETYRVAWQISPRDYFDFRIPDSFRAERMANPVPSGAGEWTVELDGTHGVALTFEFAEQVVGWPAFTITAPEDTTVELLVHEAHRSSGPPLLNTHFDSWTRFICRQGCNEFETFDFESLRWLQLHVHNAKGTVVINQVRVRRRVFPWPNEPQVRTSDPGLQRLFDASLNTLNNCAQETLVDGMARERQQYSGDGGHQLHAIHLAFGEQQLVARYLATFSQGLTKEGFFLDCWPAYDRLARLVERQFDLSGWGPILDHGVGFIFDCWSHYLYTGDIQALREPYPRLMRFAAYLQSLVREDGLLPVEDLGIPSVWIDHNAYQQQRHKQCAFNLYAAAAMEYALRPLCLAFGNTEQAEAVSQFGRALRGATVRKFWSSDHSLFVNNLPWLAEEKNLRTCDRSLSTAILFGQCPNGQTDAALRSLVECPASMGFSYPANAGWRLWALAEGGRGDLIFNDLRKRWAGMASVVENNTLQEDWQARSDSGQQWSHCAVVPLYVTFHGILGLRPLRPGFTQYEVRPQLGELEDLELTAFTVAGPVRLNSRGKLGARSLGLNLPAQGLGELILSEKEQINLPEVPRSSGNGLRRYRLPQGDSISLQLLYT